MKLEILATTAALFGAMCLVAPVKAENPAHVKQLIETAACPGGCGCNLM